MPSMYTTAQYEAEVERFKKASKADLLLIKKAFHLKPNLTSSQQARLAAAKDLLVEKRKAEARERSATRYSIQKLENAR